MKDVSNVLTVLFAKPQTESKKKMFFCPYTQKNVVTYTGETKAILPGYDPTESPQVMIRPQRLEYEYDIQYSFRETTQDSQTIDFWIQDQYFMETPIKKYFCFNCQSPNLYYAKNKVVMFDTKAEIKKGDSYRCINPLCKEKSTFTFMGIVEIAEVGAY